MVGELLSQIWFYLWYVVAAYLSLSWFFFFFPTLLHKTPERRQRFKQYHQDTWVIAHRGGSLERRENTFGAFKYAVELGVQMLEIDVVLTKDEEVVVCHDDPGEVYRMEELMGVRQHMGEFNYDDLPEFPDFTDIWGNVHNSPDDKKLPKLERLFQNFPNIFYSIDLKYGDSVVLREKVHALIKKYNMQEKVSMATWLEQNRLKMMEGHPELLCAFSETLVFSVVKALLLGYLPFMSFHNADVFSVPVPTPEYRDGLCKKYTHKYGPNSWQFRIYWLTVLFHSYILIRFTKFHFRRRDIAVLCWYPNSKRDLEYWNNFGFDGIITDRPALLKEIVREHKKNRQN